MSDPKALQTHLRKQISVMFHYTHVLTVSIQRCCDSSCMVLSHQIPTRGFIWGSRWSKSGGCCDLDKGPDNVVSDNTVLSSRLFSLKECFKITWIYNRSSYQNKNLLCPPEQYSVRAAPFPPPSEEEKRVWLKCVITRSIVKQSLSCLKSFRLSFCSCQCFLKGAHQANHFNCLVSKKNLKWLHAGCPLQRRNG